MNLFLSKLANSCTYIWMEIIIKRLLAMDTHAIVMAPHEGP
jgi:hypothetical protein